MGKVDLGATELTPLHPAPANSVPQVLQSARPGIDIKLPPPYAQTRSVGVTCAAGGPD